MRGDIHAITSRRTAAASVPGASWLGRADARRLLVVGAGRVASLPPDAYRCVRDIDTVHIWDIRPEAAEALVQRLRAQGVKAHHAIGLERAVRNAEIVRCATLAMQPLIHGAWLQPGTHPDLIGSFTAAMHESDDECFRRGAVFVDTHEALLKSGDVLFPIASGARDKHRLVATLEDLFCGRHFGRSSADEITIYKAVGTALEDLAAASFAYDATVAEQA